MKELILAKLLDTFVCRDITTFIIKSSSNNRSAQLLCVSRKVHSQNAFKLGAWHESATSINCSQFPSPTYSHISFSQTSLTLSSMNSSAHRSRLSNQFKSSLRSAGTARTGRQRHTGRPRVQGYVYPLACTGHRARAWNGRPRHLSQAHQGWPLPRGTGDFTGHAGETS